MMKIIHSYTIPQVKAKHSIIEKVRNTEFWDNASIMDLDEVRVAFGEFLSEERLSLNQLRFVRLMIDYIVANGNIEDNSVLTQEPFRSAGSITTLFKDDIIGYNILVKRLSDGKYLQDCLVDKCD